MRRLPQVAALALVVLAGCGDSVPAVSDDSAARKVIGDYLTAFYRGDGEAACALLTSKGEAGLRTESLRTGSQSCPDTIKELSSTSRKLHAPRIGVQVKSGRATATIRATRPAYESGALLEKSDGKWLIAYPPGLLQKYVGEGGVKPGAR